MIPVMEVFGDCLQGEGDRAGHPSIFVRTALCNFSCKGFGVKYKTPDGKEKMGCDSFYSVDKAFKKTWNYVEDWEELVDLIISKFPKLSKHNLMKPDIVFTGGEPLIYWNDIDYQKTLAYFISRGHHVTIETNSSIDIEFTKEYQKHIQFSMSAKLSSSEEPEHKRINIPNITKILENTKNSYLKFVISKKTFKNDIQEIVKILMDVPIYVDNIYLMPLGDTVKELEKNALFTYEKAVQYGFNYSDRLHIRMFDNKPGV